MTTQLRHMTSAGTGCSGAPPTPVNAVQVARQESRACWRDEPQERRHAQCRDWLRAKQAAAAT